MTKTSHNPKVSVIIPTYNRAHLVGRAIQSVLNQTYKDFESIVVDDGSTDNTEEAVKSFSDDRLRYIRLEENKGAQVARNTGLKAARGEYIALLDSDDEWLPEKLEKQVDKFKSASSDVGLVYCGYVSIIAEIEEVFIEQMPTERGGVFRLLVERNILGSPTVLIRKECFQKSGVFDTEFLSSQDWDMWIRIAKYYEFDFVPEILAKHYIHGKQMSAGLERIIQGLDKITRKYQNYLPRRLLSNRFRSLGSLCFYQGDFKKANRYFREAISNNPLNIGAYIRLFLCKFAPRLYRAAWEIVAKHNPITASRSQPYV